MKEGRSEARLREWFAAAPAIVEPPSLHEFLVAVPIKHPSPVRTAGRTGKPRILFLAATIGLSVAAAAFAVVGSHILDRTPGPTGLPSSSILSSSPALVGSFTRIGEHAGTRASLAMTSHNPLISVSSTGPDIGAGGTCRPSAIGSVGSSSVDWTDATGTILELAGGPHANAPIGLGVSSDCSQAIVAIPNASGGFDVGSAPNLFARDAPFFARSPLDSATLAAWVADPVKGGFISWSVDDGATWKSFTNTRPIGWDDTGVFWTIASDGELVSSQGPGFGGSRTDLKFEIRTTGDTQTPDITTAAAYRDRILVAPRGGGLQSVGTAGSTPPEQSLDLKVFDLSAGGRYVAAVGLDSTTGQADLAISADGRTFTLSPLPSAFPIGDAVRVLALDERVLLSDSGHDGVIGIWSVPVSGLPPAPAPPTPAPTPAIPSAPPPEKTATWNPVPLPSSFASPDFGLGAISALPGGGFIDFVRTGDRSAIWTSEDGTTWARLGDVTGLGLANIAGPVAFDGKRYVALGGEGGGQFYGGQSNGAAWVSTDLAHWTKAPAQEAFGGAEFRGLAADSDGFVAIGYDASGQSVWTSSDGLHWATVADDPALPRDSAQPSDVAHTAAGFLMIGRIDQISAAWTSSDGRTWSLHSPLVVGSDELPGGLAKGAEGFVSLAAGPPAIEVSPGDFRAAVTPWTSADGITWRAGPPSPALFGAGVGIVSAPGGYMAAGSVGLEPDARIWTSTNGIDWVQVSGVDLRGVGSVHLVSDGRHVLLQGSGASGPVLLVSNGVDR